MHFPQKTAPQNLRWVVVSFQLGEYPKSNQPAVVLVPQDGEVGGAVGAPGHRLQPLHVWRALPDLAVQRSKDLSADSEGGLARVKGLDSEEKLLKPLLLFLSGVRVKLNGFVLVADVKGVGSYQVVSLQHLIRSLG